MTPPRPHKDQKERILANCTVVPGGLDTNCWLWNGPYAGTTKNQGKINVRMKRGPNKGKVRSKAVHRYAYEIFTDRKPKRHTIVRHLCHNTICCNPDHMVANSTSKANNRDTVEAGRHKNQYGLTGKK